MPALNVFEVQRQPKLAEILGLSLGQGVESFAKQYQGVSTRRRAEQQKQSAATQKFIESASKNIPAYLKTHYPELQKPDDIIAIEKIYKDLINSGLAHDAAMERAVSVFSQQNPSVHEDPLMTQAVEGGKGLLRTAGSAGISALGAPVQAAGGLLHLLSSLGTKEGQPGQLQGMGTRGLQQAGQWLSNLATEGKRPLQQGLESILGKPYSTEEEAIQNVTNQLAEYAALGGAGKAAMLPAAAATGMGEVGRRIGVSPEEQTALEMTGLLGGSIRDPGKLLSSLKSMLGFGEKAPVRAAPVSEAVAETFAEKPVAAQPAKPAAPRVSELTPEMQATKLRIDRMAPEERIFQVKAQQDLLEKELSVFPKYAQEIAADNEYLAEKTSRVLGPRALATRAQRMQYAESQLPKIQEKYSVARARIRAIENEIAANPSKIQELKPLYDSFKRNLEDAEFALKQMYVNAKTGESRVGLEAMREAAQKKTLDIADKVASGEEIILGKADYNPEMVKNAEALGRKKLTPGLREGDFNTQVHQAYQDVYKQRMAQIDQKIAELKSDRSLANLYEAQRMDLEKGVLKKMSDHIDAETALHKHKMGLRELQARQTLQKRMKALRPAKETEKLGSVRERIADMKERVSTPRGRAQAIDEAAAEAVKKHPEKAGQIAKEKEAFEGAAKEAQGAADDNRSFIEQILGEGKITPLKGTHDYAKRIRKSVDNLLSKVPILGKTPVGRDILKGFASGLVDSMIPDIPVFNRIRHGTFSAVLFGRHGVGAVVSLASREAIKIAINEWKTGNLTEAYRNRDREKVAKYSKNYSPKIVSEAKKRAFSKSG